MAIRMYYIFSLCLFLFVDACGIYLSTEQDKRMDGRIDFSKLFTLRNWVWMCTYTPWAMVLLHSWMGGKTIMYYIAKVVISSEMRVAWIRNLSSHNIISVEDRTTTILFCKGWYARALMRAPIIVSYLDIVCYAMGGYAYTLYRQKTLRSTR